jgi:alanine-alpha-ketoisovalerate/valine-pyruvate aminotransferase
MPGSIKYTDSLLDKKMLAYQKQLFSIGISHSFKYFFNFSKPLSTGQKTAFICSGDGESKCSTTLLNFYQIIWHHIL